MRTELPQRLLAVRSLDDGEAVPFERKREHLAHGVLVVDEQDRWCRFGHVHAATVARGAIRSRDCQDSPAMAATRDPARRRRARRGSLERPVNARLYRSSFLLLSLPLLIAAFSVQRPAPLQRPLLPPAFDAVSTRQLADALATVRPYPTPRDHRAAESVRG